MLWSQTVPHVPQLTGSDERSAQALSHMIWPVAQGAVQRPARQVSPLEQADPHAPQFALSLLRSLHVDPHNICVALHVGGFDPHAATAHHTNAAHTYRPIGKPSTQEHHPRRPLREGAARRSR